MKYIIILVLLLLVSPVLAVEEKVEVRLEFNKDANELRVTIGNETSVTTYSTNESFSNTLSQTFDIDYDQIEVNTFNRTDLREIQANMFDEKFKDQQEWFKQTVLPSQDNLTYYYQNYVSCENRFNSLQEQYKFVNSTERKVLEEALQDCRDDSNLLTYIMIGFILLAIVVLVLTTGLGQLVKEKLTKRGM